MRLIAAILFGKLIAYLTKFFRIGGGSAAPGLYALKVYPNLIESLSKQIPRNVVITGTNGKTTTAKMLTHFAKASGLTVIRNHTGSNLERGIASTLIDGVNLSHPWGGLNRHLGIWELDEASFNTVAPKLKPDVIVFLNVFRDQLDRYGEIDTVVKNWCQTLKNISSKTLVLINGDDANTLKLAQCFKGKSLPAGRQVQKFGVKDYKIIGESIGYKKEKESLDFEAENVKLDGLKNSVFQLEIRNLKLEIKLPLPGIYHIYDFLAAFAAGVNLNLQPKQMIASLKSFSPAFGRVEKLHLPRLGSGKAGFGYIFLIKNPAGATQVFETIAPNIEPKDKLLMALNDNLADGTDVSWIWDGQFEQLTNSSSLRAPIKSGRGNLYFVSGTRAYDLALRLKYAGIDPNRILVEPDLKKALQEARMGLKGHLFILPTYTAMLELQSILVKTGIKKHYWKEE